MAWGHSRTLQECSTGLCRSGLLCRGHSRSGPQGCAGADCCAGVIAGHSSRSGPQGCDLQYQLLLCLSPHVSWVVAMGIAGLSVVAGGHGGPCRIRNRGHSGGL